MAQGIRRCCLLAAAAAVVVALALAAVEYKNPTPPRYYAAIHSITLSRTDSNDLEMNVSIGVQMRSPMWRRACLDRRAQLMVSYQRFPLAQAATGGGCASPWKLWSVHKTAVVAHGRWPVGVLADTLRVNGEFQVTFRVRSDRDHDKKPLVTCLVMPFLGLGKATACDVQF